MYFLQLIFIAKTLRVSNISKSKVAIKVKTTQPSWYYVRPNQHVVDVGGSQDVTISLNTVECKYVLFSFEFIVNLILQVGSWI